MADPIARLPDPAALAGAEARDVFANAIRGAPMAMVLADARRPDRPIVFANPAFEQLSGYAAADIVGRNCRFLQGPDTDRAAVARLRRALTAQEPLQVDLLNYRQDGSKFWNALYISPVCDADGRVRFFFGTQLDVTERIESQHRLTAQKAVIEDEVRVRTADLEAALEARTALLQEVEHRVKNNMIMMGSLLRLQARAIGDPAVRATLESMLTRVDALAAVHRRLHESHDLERFDIGPFVAALVQDAVAASGRDDIDVLAEVSPAFIPVGQAATIGLILNEIVTNAIRHAFADGRAGVLRVCATSTPAGVRIEVRDDGRGFQPQTLRPASIGGALVERLSRQIGATTSWERTDHGAHVVIALPAR